jgi:hypothetical protein
MRHGFKITFTIGVIIAGVGAGAFTAHSLRPPVSQNASLAIAYTADEDITIDNRQVEHFTIYSDGKGSRVDIRTSFDKQTGQQTGFEKSWYTADKGGFRKKNNAAELYYIGVIPMTFASSQFHRARGEEEQQMFGLPVFLTRNDDPRKGAFESWWSPDLGTLVKRTERAGDEVLVIKLTSVQFGQPDASVFVLPSLPLRYDEHDKLIRFFESRGNKDEADKQRMAQQTARQKYGDFLKVQ